jgi:hypothetical protein
MAKIAIGAAMVVDAATAFAVQPPAAEIPYATLSRGKEIRNAVPVLPGRSRGAFTSQLAKFPMVS